MGSSSSTTAAAFPPLVPVASCLTEKYMGVWFVVSVKPTMFEKKSSNAIELYTRAPTDAKHDVSISFTYNDGDPISGKLKSLPQKAFVLGNNKEDAAEWQVSPFWPVKLPYVVVELDEKTYDYCVIGYPDRSYCWIMYRKPFIPPAMLQDLKQRMVEKHQYTLDEFRDVPHRWTAAERTKRGLTAEHIPDDMLDKE